MCFLPPLRLELCSVPSPLFITHANTLTRMADNCTLKHQENSHECLSFVLVWLSSASKPHPTIEDPRCLDWFIDPVKNEAHNIPSLLPQTSVWGQGLESGRGCLRRGGVWGSLWPLWGRLQSLLLLYLLYHTVPPPPPGTSPLSFPVEREERRKGEDGERGS